MGPRAPYLHKRSRPSLSLPCTAVSACSENPSATASRCLPVTRRRHLKGAFNVTSSELAPMDLQANDNWWNGASVIDVEKPLTSLVSP